MPDLVNVNVYNKWLRNLKLKHLGSYILAKDIYFTESKYG